MHLLHFLFARHRWFLAIFAFCGALFLSNVIHWILFRILKRKASRQSGSGWGIQEHLGRPARAIFMLTCILIVLPLVPGLPANIGGTVRHWVEMAIVVAVGWFFIGLVYVLQAFMLRKYDITAADNLRARRIHTQFQVFRRILIGFVMVITAGALLWTFNDPKLWHYGAGLLASAGLASLVLASAAKSTVSNLLAGIQIAFTEPIQIDDVVVIKGDWGRIEEITAAYVVVKIWDLRRLIVPLNYFIENPVENWTRKSADILSYPYLYVDYTVPIAELRAEFERFVKANPLWDGKGMGLQVTDWNQTCLQVRCLVTCRNSSDGFNFGCEIREHMVAYVQEHYPQAFPLRRFDAENELPVRMIAAPSGEAPVAQKPAA